MRRVAGRKLRSKMEELLSQKELVYAGRKTTHVYIGRDRHFSSQGQELTARIFADRIHTHSGKYTALVFSKSGEVVLGVPVVNVSNDTHTIISHRRNMAWYPVTSTS